MNIRTAMMASSVAALALLAGGCAMPALGGKVILSTDKTYPAIGPYSQMVGHGRLIYFSGVIPLNKEGTAVQGTMIEELDPGRTSCSHKCRIKTMKSTIRIGHAATLLGITDKTLQRWEREGADPGGAHHNRGVNTAVNFERLATAALGAEQALPVASPAATLGTAAGQLPAGGGKVTPVRYEHGR